MVSRHAKKYYIHDIYRQRYDNAGITTLNISRTWTKLGILRGIVKM